MIACYGEFSVPGINFIQYFLKPCKPVDLPVNEVPGGHEYIRLSKFYLVDDPFSAFPLSRSKPDYERSEIWTILKSADIVREFWCPDGNLLGTDIPCFEKPYVLTVLKAQVE